MVDTLLDVIALLRGDIGWLLTIIIVGYEVFWPFWETKLQEKIDGYIEAVYKDIYSIKEQIDNIDEKLTHHIQVTRAMSREMDGIDDERVDSYLVENGVQVDEFIKDDD